MAVQKESPHRVETGRGDQQATTTNRSQRNNDTTAVDDYQPSCCPGAAGQPNAAGRTGSLSEAHRQRLREKLKEERRTISRVHARLGNGCAGRLDIDHARTARDRIRKIEALLEEDS